MVFDEVFLEEFDVLFVELDVFVLDWKGNVVKGF